jgi:hypothetical protein
MTQLTALHIDVYAFVFVIYMLDVQPDTDRILRIEAELRYFLIVKLQSSVTLTSISTITCSNLEIRTTTRLVF